MASRNSDDVCTKNGQNLRRHNNARKNKTHSDSNGGNIVLNRTNIAIDANDTNNCKVIQYENQ